jgi:hypothetical protein
MDSLGKELTHQKQELFMKFNLLTQHLEITTESYLELVSV